ncbi:hypothetical protein D3C78_1477050 [compost metagenome]
MLHRHAVACLAIGRLDLDLHLDLAGLLELERQWELLAGRQRLAQTEQHHVIATRLEHHLALGGNVHGRNLLHLHQTVLLHMGVQFAFLRARSAGPDQAISLGALVMQGEIGSAGRRIRRQLARPRLADGQVSSRVVLGEARQGAGEQGGQAQGANQHCW